MLLVSHWWVHGEQVREEAEELWQTGLGSTSTVVLSVKLPAAPVAVSNTVLMASTFCSSSLMPASDREMSCSSPAPAARS